MKLNEFKQLIREEVRKIIENVAPTEAQDFAIAAKKKFKDALLGVDYIKVSSKRYIVTAHVDIKKWKLADKYWANKYTKTLGNNAFEFNTSPHGASASKEDYMYGTEVKVK